ncbi:hypothetical protein GCM10020218_018730 [Dactylosporangium vinaceum]
MAPPAPFKSLTRGVASRRLSGTPTGTTSRIGASPSEEEPAMSTPVEYTTTRVGSQRNLRTHGAASGDGFEWGFGSSDMNGR